MNPYRKSVCRLLCLLVLTALLSTGALAATLEVDAQAVSCLSQEAFSDGASALSGIYVSAVPAVSVCEIRCGARSIRAGDVLPASALDTLTVAPAGSGEGECSLYYRPIYSNGVGIAQELRFSLLRGKNQAPSAGEARYNICALMCSSRRIKSPAPSKIAEIFSSEIAPT